MLVVCFGICELAPNTPKTPKRRLMAGKVLVVHWSLMGRNLMKPTNGVCCFDEMYFGRLLVLQEAHFLADPVDSFGPQPFYGWRNASSHAIAYGDIPCMVKLSNSGMLSSSFLRHSIEYAS